VNDKKLIISPDTKRKERIPPGQKATDNWPVLHYGSIPDIDISKWTFTISGLVKQLKELSYQEFLLLEQVKVFSDIHCVTTWSKKDNLWEGVSSGTIKDMAQVMPEARFVIIHAAGGFTANLTLDDFLETDVLFVLKHNDETLTLEHGYPVRLVVPRLYFWKSAKWVTGVEFTAEDKPGFWEGHGYHNRGNPWLEERYSQ
jgi:DMSO/TMAO reductase YedYZ molybdopterin-dependent catalytic subunit